MKRIIILALLSIAILFVGIINAQTTDEITIDVSLDLDTIGMDEFATLQIVVAGKTQNLPDPNMPTLSMFDVMSQGRSSNFNYNNGAVSTSLTYRYLLVPKRPGTFPIDQISVVYNNKRYKGNEVELTVLSNSSSVPKSLTDKAVDARGDTKNYFLEAVVDNPNPYVNEQITLTLKFYISIQYYGSPELSEPTTTGFWTEILGNKAPYYQTINKTRYKVIERKYALFPTQTGELEIGRALIRVTVASKSSRQDDFFGFFGRGQEVSIRSNLLKINVKEIPDKLRPDDFTGTIGRYNISATANKTEVEANQPVSVTVKVTGTGNIKSVAEPIIPEMEEKFRVYRASTSENISKVNDKIGGTKIFEEVFIPKRPGDLEIPAIAFNYFDPSTHTYKAISTDPIKLKVTKPEGFVASADIPFDAPDAVISSNSRDIRFIKEDLGDTRQKGKLTLREPVYIFVNALPVLVFVGLMVVRIRDEKLSGDVGYARSKAALKEAKKRLSKAKSIASTNSTADFYLEVYTALVSFIADKLNISPHGLTTDKIKTLLIERNANEELVNQIITIMKRSDFARYAPSNITQEEINKDLSDAENIMVEIVGVKFE